MTLAIGLLLRKSIFLYLLRVFVWFQAMMLVALLISPLAVSNAPHLVLLGVDLQGDHYLGLLGLLVLVIWQGWVAYSPVVRCYLNRTPYRGNLASLTGFSRLRRIFFFAPPVVQR